ncbi:hypothetical protein KQI72_05460 [Eubacterium sp. MSJ-21]|jgi:hypothetical protein|nr:hypothetical protein [Eubacterium sp. MSJ-21]
MKRKHIARKIFAMAIAATMCMGLSPAGYALAAQSINTNINVYNIEAGDVSCYSMQDHPCNSMHPSANGQDLTSTQEPANTQAPATTQADGKSDSKTQTDDKSDTDTQTDAMTLKIDDANQYDGMEKPYKDGYVPINANGSVRIVFPILSEGELRGNTLRAALDLGDAQTAPFVFKNYEKDIRLQTVKVNANTQEVSAYVADFTVELKGKRTNGSYPVILKVTAKDTKGNAVEQEFTSYVTIADGIDPDATTEAVVEPVAEDLPTFAPKIMVKSYNYSKSEIQPGDEVKADIVLLNTSKENTVKNMTIAVTADTESFTLLSQSDSVYIEKLAPQEETTITFSYRINAKTAAGQYDLELAMDYADGDGNTYSTSGKAKITVQQSSEMQFDDLSFPSEVVVADVVEAKVQAMNLGRSKIYNVRAEIAADGLKPQGTIFIGDMEAGTAVTGSTQVSVSSLSGSKLYGNTEGTVTYYYEDESGKEYTEEATFTTTIKSPFSDQKEETTPDNTNQWWVIMAVILGCIAVAAGVIIIRKIRLKKQDAEDE